MLATMLPLLSRVLTARVDACQRTTTRVKSR